MSYIYSQALVEAFSEACSLGTGAFAPSNPSPTHRPCLWHDKTMEPSRLSRFGMTCEPLTDGLGADVLTWFLEDSLAKTSAQPVAEPVLTERAADCGANLPALFAKYDPVLSVWKTAQCSLLEDSDEFLQTWPDSGLMRDGACYPQPMLAPATCVNESGLWPTPVKSDGVARRPSKNWEGNSDLPSVVWRRSGGQENPEKPPAKLNADWVEWLMGWPIGHTDLKPLETDKLHEWQQQHSPY